MRKFAERAGTAAILLVGFNFTAAQAETPTFGITCDQFATTAADQASKDFLQRATPRARTAPGKVLVIAGGAKFYMPQHQADDESLAPESVWTRMQAWNAAYSDAFHMCERTDEITLKILK